MIHCWLRLKTESKVNVCWTCQKLAVLTLRLKLTSRGVIFSYDITDLTAEEILKELKSQIVINVKFITRRLDGHDGYTPTLILTFNSPTSPERVKIIYFSVCVWPYIPNPRWCFLCHAFGHTKTKCKKEKKCGQVGNEDIGCLGINAQIVKALTALNLRTAQSLSKKRTSLKYKLTLRSCLCRLRKRPWLWKTQ